MAQNSSKKQTIAEPEVLYVESKKVACDGGVGSLGHPMVYLQINADGFAECPYCDKQFIMSGTASDKR